MSENESHGQSDTTPAAPGGFQLGPPEGQRFARGELPPFSDEIDEAPQPTLDFTEVSSPSEVIIEDDPEPMDYAPEPPPPPPSDNNGHYSPFGNADTPRDKELGLFEHLAELRIRILWSFAWLGIGMSIAWHYGTSLQKVFAHPIVKVLEENNIHGGLIITNPTGGLSIYFYFSLFAGLIISMPAIIYQVWKFIDPALTNSERRYSVILIPFSIVLFFLGTALGYAVSPLFFQFFLAFLPPDTTAMWDYYESIILMAKMLLVFGVVFQVPIVIIFLHKLGLVSRNVLIEYWRHAVVVIFTVVAILTPTWDPLSMTVCALPPCILYGLSIWLIKWL